MANKGNLEYLTTGSASLKRKWKALVDASKRIPIPGANITVTDTPDGPAFNAIIQFSSENITHPFKGLDGSDGSSALVSFQAGALQDLTNSKTWATTGANIIFLNDYAAGIVPFATLIPDGAGGMRLPKISVAGATATYLSCTVTSATGNITAIVILADTGGGVPAGSATQFNTLLTSVTVTTDSKGLAHVKIYDDGAQSALYYAICGALPLTDATSYRIGT